jgi:hypothetical protein
MKILYILGSYYPAQSGGPNNTIHWQAKYLSKEDVDVYVASLRGLINLICDLEFSVNTMNSKYLI